MQQDALLNSKDQKNEWQKRRIQQDINQDLIRLRQMNSAFAKMNQNYLNENNEYYSYNLQQTSNLSNYQSQQHEILAQHTEIQHNTERSNSLLFTLSQKDQDQTRPATYLNNFQYDTTRHTEYQVHNPNKFGQFQFDPNQSMTVNNTIFQHQTLHNNVFSNLNYRNINQSMYEKQIQQEPQNFNLGRKNQTYGFSKYEQFAIKISRLFNIQVEDLQIIYNQLKAQKENQNQETHSQRQYQKQIQISDSEVMKKLFDYALQIKNSHHKLVNIITTIDQRIDKKPQKNASIQNQAYVENVSINFMLEEENNRQMNNNDRNLGQKDDKTKRFNRNVFGFGQQDRVKENQQNVTLQSKNTIIGKLVGNKKVDFEMPSGQTIQSSRSIVESQKTNSKSHKSKKNKRVNQKIRLISQQLQSLKRQIDQEDEQEEQTNIKNPPIQQNNQIQNHVVFQQKIPQQLQPFFQENKNTTVQFSSVNKQNDLISKKQPIAQKRQQINLQLEPYIFAGQSFTYVKSIQQIPEDDPQIDKKIQQTIKTCIVKSPSKKSLIIQKSQTEIQKQKIDLNQEKKNQKIIVEPASPQNLNQKYSFKDRTFSTNMAQNTDIRAQNRQKIFKSIAQIRKSLSKDKKMKQNYSKPTQFKKTSNNPYLDEEQNIQKQRIQVSSYHLNIQRSKQKKSSLDIQSYQQKVRFVTDHSNQIGKFYEKQNVFRQGYQKRETPIKHVQQIKITPPKNLIQPSNQNIRFISPNHQSFIIKQNQLPQKQISYSQQNIQPSFQRQPFHQKRNTISFGGYQNLYSAKTVESRPFIQSEKIINKQIFNQPYSINQAFVSPPKVIPGNQKVKLTTSPKNGLIMIPNNLKNHQKNYQNTRISIPKNQIIQRPITPVNMIEKLNQSAQNFKQRSFSSQKIRPNQSLAINLPKPVYQNESFENKRKNSIKFIPTSNKSFVYRPNKFITTERNASRSIQRRNSVPIIVVTPQKNNQLNFKQKSIEKPTHNVIFKSSDTTNLQFKKLQNLYHDHQSTQQKITQSQKKPEMFTHNQRMTQTFGQRPLSQLQTPYFNSNTLIQQQHQFIESQKNPPAIQTISAALKNEQRSLKSPKLQQSLMYYGTINKVHQEKPHQQFNLMTSRKNESVVHAFPVQIQQSQKMNNSVYAQEQYQQKIPIQQIPVSNSNVFYKEKQSSLRRSQNLSNKTPRIPNNYKPPKYIPPKQVSFYDKNQPHTLQIQNQMKTKNLEESKPLRQPMYGPGSPPVKTYTLGHLVQSSRDNHFINQSKKSHTAVNASAVKSPQEQLSDSTPSFGVFNEQFCSNTMFVNPFSKSLSNLIDSRNSSGSKRSASSRSKSSKKGIALQSKRSKSPQHKFYQSSYNS